jgi:hypothetical protein
MISLGFVLTPFGEVIYILLASQSLAKEIGIFLNTSAMPSPESETRP